MIFKMIVRNVRFCSLPLNPQKNRDKKESIQFEMDRTELAALLEQFAEVAAAIKRRGEDAPLSRPPSDSL